MKYHIICTETCRGTVLLIAVEYDCDGADFVTRQSPLLAYGEPVTNKWVLGPIADTKEAVDLAELIASKYGYKVQTLFRYEPMIREFWNQF